jgi:hypothetical protein
MFSQWVQVACGQEKVLLKYLDQVMVNEERRKEMQTFMAYSKNLGE